MGDMPLVSYRDTLYDITSELDEALDQIRQGQCNQGIAAWQRSFLKGHSKLKLFHALDLRGSLADVLVENDLVEDARQVDRQIVQELVDDEDNDHPLLGPEERKQLYDEVQRRYGREPESPSWGERSLSSMEQAGQERVSQVVPKTLSQSHHYYTRSRGNIAASTPTIPPKNPKASAREAEDRLRTTVPNETDPEAHRNLQVETIVGPKKELKDDRICEDSATAQTELADDLTPYQKCLLQACNIFVRPLNKIRDHTK
jgi:hypothetical protein